MRSAVAQIARAAAGYDQPTPVHLAARVGAVARAVPGGPGPPRPAPLGAACTSLGLLGPSERKAIRPLAARVAPADGEQLHHFVAASTWDPAPVEAVLAREAQRLVGGDAAVLIVDDTALPKKGAHSVGVAHQYCGALGKTANCQALVSLTLARGEVPVPVALRLFLPAAWTRDPARCDRAGVPPARQRFRAKTAIALEEVDRVRAAGVTFGTVLADAGYGKSAAFRRAPERARAHLGRGRPRGAARLPARRGRAPAGAAAAGRPPSIRWPRPPASRPRPSWRRSRRAPGAR